MAASYCKRLLAFVPLLGLTLALSGCPDPQQLGEVLPPPPPPDFSVEVDFNFEAAEMPPVSGDSFTIGNPPVTAKFTGGAVMDPDNDDLVRVGEQAWIIDENGTGSIEFASPARYVQFFFRNEVAAPAPPAGVASKSSAARACGAPDLGRGNEEFGAPIFARGAFNGWGASDDTRFRNQGGGVYRAEFEMAASVGGYPFKIATEDWSTEYIPDGRPALVVDGEARAAVLATEGGAPNDSITGTDEDDCYVWTVTVTNTSSVPAPEIQIQVAKKVEGPVAAGSEVRLYDTFGDIINTLSGVDAFIRVEEKRDPSQLNSDDDDDTLIARIEIENMGPPPIPCAIADAGLDNTEAFGSLVFARGGFNGWADPPVADYQFVNVGEGTYRAQFEIDSAGTQEFKIASADWATQYSGESGANTVTLDAPFALPVGDRGANLAIDFPEPGCYTWDLDVTDEAVPAATELTVSLRDFVPAGVGRTSVDDFEFRADPAQNRSIALVYLRPNGDFGSTQIEVTGDVIGGDQTLDCAALPGTTLACIARVRLIPGGEFTYTVLNDGIPDDAGAITLRGSQITPDNVVFTFTGSRVPLARALPEQPGENEVILFYKRDDDNYDGWGLHLFPSDSDPWTLWPEAYPFAGIDPELGAYFIIALPGSARLTEPYSASPAPRTSFPAELGFIIHNGDNKDPGPDQFIRIAEHGQLVFVRSGVDAVSTSPPVAGAVAIANAEAHWVTENTLVWDHPGGVASVELLYSASAAIREAGGQIIGADERFTLTPGSSPSLPGARHIEGNTPYALPAAAVSMAKDLVTGQLIAVALDAAGEAVAATRVQFPLALDALYASAAGAAELGVTYSGSAPSVALWAPTSTSVALNIYDAATSMTPSDTLPMNFDAATGIWSLAGTSAWDRKYYTFTVNNFAPTAKDFVEVEVTDPYSLNLSADSDGRLVKSQFLNLDDADLKPEGWDTLVKPALAAPEDIVLYELHIRDFSALDTSVPEADQGKYSAFAGDGAGMMHLESLAGAGLTHVHLLPFFDIATVDEEASERVDIDHPIEDLCAVQSAAQSLCDSNPGATIREVMASFGPTDSMQAQIAEWLRGIDSFNWGYDPYHFNAPEGSYASDPDGVARVLELRQAVQGLAEIGLRTVMDQVYNHTNASGHASRKSVFDKIVPGYYHRYDEDTGLILRETCCDDTAAEHAMFEKFIIDSATQWVTAYKIDGFRFDLMAFHPKSTMEKLGDTLASLTLLDDGVDGSTLYIYGEGWNTGIAAGDSRFTAARQDNLGGTGIGSFNDRIRDAVRGGGPFDSGDGHLQSQGFISGLYYDPNEANSGSDDELASLLSASDRIRASLAGGLEAFAMVSSSDDSVTTAGALGAGYTEDPQEIVNYVSSHDNETLWDISQYKHPTATSTMDRVRAHNLGNALVLLGQGVPFIHAGQEGLRSKSMDRNSFDAGDWFNRLDFTGMDNNFAVGLPLAGDNASSLTQIAGVLAIPEADPGAADIAFAADVTAELLQIRKSSALFRLRNAAEIFARVQFHNTGTAQVPGLIVMSLDGCVSSSLTPEFGSIVVVFNARTDDQVFDLFGGRTFSLHPVQADLMSADAVTRTAFHDTAGFHVPARTAAVFVEAQSGAMCAFGTGWTADTAYLSGDFNANTFVQAFRRIGETDVLARTGTLAAGLGALYRIQSADMATINCGSPMSGTSLPTPIGATTVISCGADAGDLSVDVTDAGTYKFLVDTTNEVTPSLEIRALQGAGFPAATDGCGVAGTGMDDGEAFGAPMFTRGGFNGWGTANQFVNVGGGDYQTEFEMAPGNYEFKIAKEDWTLEYARGEIVEIGVPAVMPTPGPNTPIQVVEPGCYNWNMSVTDPAVPPPEVELTVSYNPQVGTTPTAPPFVRGAFNGWGEGDPLSMTATTQFERVVTIAAPGLQAFKIASSDWATVNCGGLEGGSNLAVAVDTPTTINCDNNPGNLEVDIPAAGDYLFEVDATNRANPTLTISPLIPSAAHIELPVGFAVPRTQALAVIRPTAGPTSRRRSGMSGAPGSGLAFGGHLGGWRRTLQHPIAMR